MKAYQVTEYKENNHFVEVDIEKPKIKSGHVLIEVKATSLNPVDHKILTADIGINPDSPAILHMDVSGIVVEVADDIQTFKIGDEVYGCAGGLQSNLGRLDGALADYMIADAKLIALKPKTLDFGTSAALPLVSITAFEGLFDRMHIQKDDYILIHGATGGVGHIAIQLAKQHGVKVAATISSAQKAQIAKDLGADDIINYRNESVESYVNRLTNGEGFSAIYDTIGGENLDLSLKAAKINGQVATTVGMNNHDLTNMHIKGLSLHLIFMLLPMITGAGRSHHHDILTQIAGMVDEGQITPLIHEESFTFAQANEAHALFASGKHLGKIILTNY